LELMLEH